MPDMFPVKKDAVYRWCSRSDSLFRVDPLPSWTDGFR